MSKYLGRCVAAILVAVLTAAPAPASWSAGEPVLVHGPRPPGATVIVSLRPTGGVLNGIADGGSVPSMNLPVTLTDMTFAVSVAPGAIPTQFVDREPDGSRFVDVQVVAVQPDGESFVSNASAQVAVVAGGEAWVDPQAPVTSDGARVVAASSVGSTGVSVGNLEPIGVNVVTSAARVQGAAGACTTTVLGRHAISARIGASYPVGRSTSWLRVDHSNGGRYQAAMKVPNHPVKKLNYEHAAGGWGVVTGRSGATRAYFTNVRYATFDNRYRDTRGLCQYYLTYEPMNETGAMYSKAVARPNWTHCQPLRFPMTWRRNRSDGSPWELEGGVSAGTVVGISLGLSKQYSSSSHTLAYHVPKRARVCGDNRDPALASKVMEKVW